MKHSRGFLRIVELNRSSSVIAVGLVVLALVSWWALRESQPKPKEEVGVADSSAGKGSAQGPSESGVPAPRLRPRVPEAGGSPEQAADDDLAGDLVPAPDSDDIAAAWSVVDLEEVRKALPDNLYFEMSAPTNDPAVLAERQAERERWNVEYGKVLSGTGTEEEVREYYDQRARLSTDYVEFTTYLLDHYSDDLPERDIGLLQLARRLHLARLEEIPRKVQEALERKREQDAVRDAWLADEAKFGADRDGQGE